MKYKDNMSAHKGQKIVTETGLDNGFKPSAVQKGALKGREMKGSCDNIDHSIKGGKVNQGPMS